MTKYLGIIAVLLLVFALPTSAAATTEELGEKACANIEHPNYAFVRAGVVLRSEPVRRVRDDQEVIIGYNVLVENADDSAQSVFSRKNFQVNTVVAICKRGKNHKLAPLQQ